MAWRIGVDTGGTFTDICLYDEAGTTLSVLKVPSTPTNAGKAVVSGVLNALGLDTVDVSAQPLSSVNYLAHGTTVGTNTLLESKGAKVALITTDGFGDLLELARQKRPKLYDLFAQKPAPLVSAAHRYEVEERVAFDGTVLTPLNLESVKNSIQAIKQSDIDAVAVCFLYSYLRPDHEREVVDLLKSELPGKTLSISHEVLPEFREYERLSTTVINAYLAPIMSKYLSGLRAEFKTLGLAGMPQVSQSNGGVISFQTAEQLPVRTVFSGPSAGVTGAARLAQQAGIRNIIAFDMGGTSSDVALVEDGEPQRANGMTLDGRPIQAPMLEINTVGTGGGSIAWVDEGGHLKVGPHSAGATPGPACYELGNDQPTVTDANVVIGTLNQTHLLGGEMPINAQRSFDAIETLGKKLGLSTVETAEGIISVVIANMTRAIRVVSVQRGHDPGDFTLVAYGGAGPLHCGRLADELGITQVLIPPHPGTMSAVGLLMTDMRTDFTQTHRVILDETSFVSIQEVCEELKGQAENWLDRSDVEPADRSFQYFADVRYLGQNYELTVSIEEPLDMQGWLKAVAAAFEEQYRARYGYLDEGQPIQLVTLRLEATGQVPRATYEAHHYDEDRSATQAVVSYRDVHLANTNKYQRLPVYDRNLLQPGHSFSGPAVVEQYDTTTFIPDNYTVTVDSHAFLIANKTLD